MKKIFLLIPMMFAMASFAQQGLFAVTEHKSPDGKYTYRTVANDPIGVRVYTLENGLTVMLSVNKNEPRIQTLIATKAGSKNDPKDNTGLAHYLEHMLFKGTDKYGTLDWPKEKEQLDKIDALYEKYNQTTNESQRTKIYHDIDSISGVASTFAIANEYDKLMQAIGATGTNAFTSLEQTVYVNDIPSNNVEKWLTIEAERFRNPVLRLFHTELEAVYEEKNISLDNDTRKMFEAMMTNLFTRHTYGTQTTIGTVEHLKNPSLLKIRNYYNTFYVPNNMAIIMAGDFDPDQTIRWVDEKFGYMKPKPIPPFTFDPEPVRTAPHVVEVLGPDAENLLVAFRLPGASSKDALLLALTDYMLANSKAGLIDLNLVKKQKVLSAGSQTWINKDYSIHMLTGKPLQGQSLEQVKDLLLEQLSILKEGNFDDQSLKAVISNFKVDQIKNNESNSGRAYTILDAYTSDIPWEKRAAFLHDLSRITKQEVIDFANRYYNNDFVIVYKRVGEDNSIVKVPKPEITPVQVNREEVSPFVKSILDAESPHIKPVFLDFEKDMLRTKVGKAPMYYVQNKDNGLFKLYYVLDMGKFNDLKLPQAVNLLEYLGTDKFSAEQISKEFFKLACDFGVSVGDDQCYVYLSGLDDNFVPALRLFEHLLANAKPDQKALDEMVERTLKQRADARLNKNIIFRTALRNYAMYGPNNPFRHILSAGDLKALKAEELTSKYIHELTSWAHKIYYYGPQRPELLQGILAKEHKMPGSFSRYPKPTEFKRLETGTNQVLFTDYKMVQAEVMWLNKQPTKFDTTLLPVVSMFNEYFGGGMSSIVFQTIRESKALAYSTYSFYQQPNKKQDPYYIIAYVGTQADKLNEAMGAMNDLLQNMPVSDNKFESAKAALINQIETERVIKEGIIFTIAGSEKLGLYSDGRKVVYDKVVPMKFEDLNRFYTANYKGKTFTYAIMGSKEKINMTDLKKYGEVKEVTLEELFGY
jgi:predicted Zn-dependent peptidase